MSISNMIDMRKNFQHKICYKDKYRFLKLKSSPTLSLANRFIKRGNFLKIYKILKVFFSKIVLQKIVIIL